MYICPNCHAQISELDFRNEVTAYQREWGKTDIESEECDYHDCETYDSETHDMEFTCPECEAYTSPYDVKLFNEDPSILEPESTPEDTKQKTPEELEDEARQKAKIIIPEHLTFKDHYSNRVSRWDNTKILTCKCGAESIIEQNEPSIKCHSCHKELTIKTAQRLVEV